MKKEKNQVANLETQEKTEGQEKQTEKKPTPTPETLTMAEAQSLADKRVSDALKTREAELEKQWQLDLETKNLEQEKKFEELYQKEKLQRELLERKREDLEAEKQVSLELKNLELPGAYMEFVRTPGEEIVTSTGKAKKLNEIINQEVEIRVSKRLETPQIATNTTNGNLGSGLTMAQIKNMSRGEINKRWEEVEKVLAKK